VSDGAVALVGHTSTDAGELAAELAGPANGLEQLADDKGKQANI
jgi:hypothetical protein